MSISFTHFGLLIETPAGKLSASVPCPLHVVLTPTWCPPMNLEPDRDRSLTLYELAIEVM